MQEDIVTLPSLRNERLETVKSLTQDTNERLTYSPPYQRSGAFVHPQCSSPPEFLGDGEIDGVVGGAEQNETKCKFTRVF